MSQPDTLYDRVQHLVNRLPPDSPIAQGWQRLLADVAEGRTLPEPISDRVLDAFGLNRPARLDRHDDTPLDPPAP